VLASVSLDLGVTVLPTSDSENPLEKGTVSIPLEPPFASELGFAMASGERADLEKRFIELARLAVL
jgi:hypothetical protein